MIYKEYGRRDMAARSNKLDGSSFFDSQVNEQSYAQADILTMINEEYGFEYEQETPWHEVFAEAPMSPRAAADGAAAAPVTFKTLADFLAHADLPDSDADDSSYRCVLPLQGCCLTKDACVSVENMQRL